MCIRRMRNCLKRAQLSQERKKGAHITNETNERDWNWEITRAVVVVGAVYDEWNEFWNQARSMVDNISWSNLPWPERLMRVHHAFVCSRQKNDTCKTIKPFWLNNNNSISGRNGGTGTGSSTSRCWTTNKTQTCPGCVCVFCTKWNCDDPWLVIHHISLLFHIFFANITFQFWYTVVFCAFFFCTRDEQLCFFFGSKMFGLFLPIFTTRDLKFKSVIFYTERG